MALSKQLQDRIEAVAADLRKELYGPKGYPPWGTKFVEMEAGVLGDRSWPNGPNLLQGPAVEIAQKTLTTKAQRH